jgi:hypothetical protein
VVTLYYFLIGAGGAAAYELLRLYVLMGKLPKRKFMAMIRSPLYVSVTFGLVVASGFIAWGINANADPTPWQLIMSGIGARSLVSKPAEIHFAKGGATLGGSAPDMAPAIAMGTGTRSRGPQSFPPLQSTQQPGVTLRDIFTA